MKKILLVVLTLFFNVSFARDFGVMGTTYEIKEQSMLSLIMDRLHFLKSTGFIEKQQAEMLADVKNYIQNPTPVKHISRTEKPRTFYYNPAFILQEDLYTPDGKLIHKKGTVFNPADYIPFKKVLVFFDANDAAQVEWLKKWEKTVDTTLTKILISGPIREKMQAWQERLYFDQKGLITSRLGIQQVPAIVKQEGHQLRIDEVMP